MLTVKHDGKALVYYDDDRRIKYPKAEIKRVRVNWPNGVVEDYEAVWLTVNHQNRLTIKEVLFGLPFQPPLWEYLPHLRVEILTD